MAVSSVFSALAKAVGGEGLILGSSAGLSIAAGDTLSAALASAIPGGESAQAGDTCRAVGEGAGFIAEIAAGVGVGLTPVTGGSSLVLTATAEFLAGTATESAVTVACRQLKKSFAP